MPADREISYKQELIRKAIHLNSLSIPIIYSFITRELALTILIPLTILFVVVDILSNLNKMVREIIHQIFGKMMRAHEVGDKLVLNGATWVLLSATLCIFIFPKVLAVTGFGILIISDLSAALIGRKFGRHKLFKTKSWEGTGAFMISALIVIMIIGTLIKAPYTYYIFGSAAAIIAGFVEAASSILKMDDNLSIPVSICLVMLLGNYISTLLVIPTFLNLM